MISWEAKARPKQLEPKGDWFVWLIQTGRGWGKTETGAQTTISRCRRGLFKHGALVAPNAADARDIMVNEAKTASGILPNSPSDFYPNYVPSKRRLEWPNGAIVSIYSSEDPDQLRGPEHDWFWADEVAAWKNREENWHNLMFGLRKGSSQGMVTTTPRPIALLRMIRALPGVKITGGDTDENIFNLSQRYIETVIQPYRGTRLGRQEISGELIEDNEAALFDLDTIDRNRISPEDAPEFFDTIVVAIDPTGSKTGHGVGITVGGRSGDTGYLLADYSLESASPNRWANHAIEAYLTYGANRITAEKNYGGEMVANTIRLNASIREIDPIPIKEVDATQGKTVRAEPVSMLMDQGRIKHVGEFKMLEDQLINLEDGQSDDRADSYVWLFTDLLGSSLRHIRARAGDIKSLVASGRPDTTLGNIWNKRF